MSDETAKQAFLKVILSEPENESHRLIYADWLEEHGEPKEADKFRTLHGLAAVWSTKWGNDEFGLWATLTFKKASQRMRWIPPGSFWMGSAADEPGHKLNEGPRHRVTITKGFWYADTPCTQKMWEAVLRKNPSRRKGLTFPVGGMSWENCQSFLTKCNESAPGLHLTLPTEAEWEYACRAGTEGPLYSDDLDAIAWHWKNSGERIRSVGRKQPNAWGLYDTLGNVWEWCHDAPRPYTDEPQIDPVYLSEPKIRVYRGHCWIQDQAGPRAPNRDDYTRRNRNGNVGFRFVIRDTTWEHPPS